MAILIPDTPKDCTRSERVVYQRLGGRNDGVSVSTDF